MIRLQELLAGFFFFTVKQLHPAGCVVGVPSVVREPCLQALILAGGKGRGAVGGFYTLTLKLGWNLCTICIWPHSNWWHHRDRTWFRAQKSASRAGTGTPASVLMGTKKEITTAPRRCLALHPCFAQLVRLRAAQSPGCSQTFGGNRDKDTHTKNCKSVGMQAKYPSIFQTPLPYFTNYLAHWTIHSKQYSVDLPKTLASSSYMRPH